MYRRKVKIVRFATLQTRKNVDLTTVTVTIKFYNDEK